MRLQQWKANGWLQAHQTTPAQIADLLAIVDRDLEDSMRDLSPDWQFGIAYNAALKLCTILLYASGYRPEKNLAHYRTLAALPLNRRSNIHLYPDDWKKLPIPDVSPAQQQPIIDLVEQILTLKRANPAADIRALETQLDTAVAALYGLTPEEIAIVEGTAK